MIDRRALIRAGVLGIVGAPILAACGEGRPDGRRTAVTPEVVSSDLERALADPGAIGPVVAALHEFGAGLWERVASQPGNVAISPYSVLTALAMTANGAVGRTQEEMLDVLGADQEALNAGVNALTRHVESLARRKGVVDAANQLFAQRGTHWEQDFLDVLAREYGAAMRLVDYAGDTEGARRAVNAWTAEQTHDRIEEILPGGSVDASTRLVLVNTLYLKAAWAAPFAKAPTADRPFHLTDGTAVSVPTMTGIAAGAAVGRGVGWTAVRLPYAGGDLAMTLLLPDPGRELPIADVPAVLASVRPVGVELSLPRFTFRTKLPLGGPLAALGMPTAFTPGKADLSAMTHDEPLYLDQVFHEVFVAVDEEGTEAAAATAVAVRTVSMPVAQERVVLDRPFGFVIHDVEHGAPLFVGRVDDPR
jgi:serpin B